MRWIRRLSVVAQVVGWTDIGLFIIGVPGHIEDTATWYGWVKPVFDSPAFILATAFVITGPFLWTSPYWWPRVSTWVKRIRATQETQDRDALPAMATAVHLEKFRELEPLIARHREALAPVRNPYLLTLVWDFTDRFAFRADREDLVAHLAALRIPSPPADGSRSAWYHYLVQLELLCQTGDLDEARTLHDAEQPSNAEGQNA